MSGPRVRAIVLAAGAGSRFGGRKLEADLDGRPIMQHVLDALAAAGFGHPIVVVAGDGPAGMDWRGAERVTNPEPETGLASSLRIGWERALRAPEPPDAVLIALGDQPRVRAEVIRRLARARLDPSRPVVAPRYAGSSARNPVRLETAAGALVAAATGNRGLGPLLDEHPELVRSIEFAGDNPDIDTPADLAHVAEAMRAPHLDRKRP